MFQRSPCFHNFRWQFTTITGFQISLQPYVRWKAFRTPRQFIQEFKHNRIILYPLRRSPYATHSFPIHSSMQTDISSEVQQHTIKPVVLAKAFLTIPHRIRVSPLRTFLAIQIQHQHISGIQHIDHSRTRICLPCLNDPDSFRIGFLHGFHYRSSGLRQVYPFCVASNSS